MNYDCVALIWLTASEENVLFIPGEDGVKTIGGSAPRISKDLIPRERSAESDPTVFIQKALRTCQDLKLTINRRN
jgi:hypothetical protein